MSGQSGGAIPVWQRIRRDYGRQIDYLIALLLLAGAFPGTFITTPAGHTPPSWWIGVPIAAIGCASMVWRRSRPRAVTLISIACFVVLTALGFQPTAYLLGPVIVALFTLADRTNRMTANFFTAGAVLASVATAVIVNPRETIDLTVIAPVAIMLLSTSLGTATNLRRNYLEEAQARADHAERTREEEARHRAAAERVRIARDLHDVVAHHLALANAQAGAVTRLVRTQPEKAHELAVGLAATTSTALRELKATVGLLRQADEPAALHPAPGLGQLPELATALKATGLDVHLVTEGEPRQLSPGVELTAYRIVQEALTNVGKHAATRTAQVRVIHTSDVLRVEVTNRDDGMAPAAPAPSSGYGLTGMRERAAAVGGRLTAGPRDGGGYAVIAELPLQPTI
jgi:signal transduction histidine kinase